MRTIESELHDILLDLAPDTHELEEQALIVAEASAIYSQTSTQNNKTAGKNDPSRIHEAYLTDALLQSMGKLAEISQDDFDDDYCYCSSVDGTGLSAEQIIHRAASSSMIRLATPGFGDGMDILNDEDLSVFLNPVIENHQADDYNITDAEPRHPQNTIYRTPGTPHAQSDSRAGYSRY